jgi:hypothetical protein
MIRAIVVASALCLAGCNATTGGGPSALASIKREAPTSLSAEQSAVIEQHVKASLKDPYSAMFGSKSATINEKGVITVCGYVNAKNSFGGYTGMQPYSGVLTGASNKQGFVVISVGGSETEQTATLQVCRAAGANV